MLGDQLKLVGPRPGAMRQRQPWAQETDAVEEFQDAAGIIGVEPGPLGAGLQEVHMDAPAGPLGSLRNRLQQIMRAPLHRLRTVLHVEHRISRRRGHGIDQSDLHIDWQRRPQETLADFVPRLRR